MCSPARSVSAVARGCSARGACPRRAGPERTDVDCRDCRPAVGTRPPAQLAPVDQLRLPRGRMPCFSTCTNIHVADCSRTGGGSRVPHRVTTCSVHCMHRVYTRESPSARGIHDSVPCSRNPTCTCTQVRYCTWYVGLGGDTQYTAEATATIVYSGSGDAMRCLSVCLCFDGFHSAEPMKRRILSVEISTFIAALPAFISKERLNS